MPICASVAPNDKYMQWAGICRKQVCLGAKKFNQFSKLQSASAWRTLHLYELLLSAHFPDQFQPADFLSKNSPEFLCASPPKSVPQVHFCSILHSTPPFVWTAPSGLSAARNSSSGPAGTCRRRRNSQWQLCLDSQWHPLGLAAAASSPWLWLPLGLAAAALPLGLAAAFRYTKCSFYVMEFRPGSFHKFTLQGSCTYPFPPLS